MKITTGLKGLISIIAAIFLILQLLLIGSAAFVRPSYVENWNFLGGMPPKVETNITITNQGLFPIQNFQISIEVSNDTGLIMNGTAGPTTIQQMSSSIITVELTILMIGVITTGDYTLLATVSGIFLGSLISFTITVNYTSTFSLWP